VRGAGADDLRARIRERMREMSPADRIALALRLGDEAVATYAANHGVTAREAREILRDASERARRRAQERHARR
jgi:division protein CdvB (Snf7/Vps24/ESCRT-III family)